MPTYQYACTECEHAFDQVQTFSEDSLTICPRCEGRLRKIFNAVGVVFKGSGFYRTDNRAESKSSSGNSSGNSSGDSGGSVKTESKKTESAADAQSTKSAGESNGKSNGKASESSSKPKVDSSSTA